MQIKKINISNVEQFSDLKAGDKVLLSGIIYTARDAAHKRLIDLLNKGEELPFDIKDKVIYYAGPAPAKPGRVIGSIGPTTSYRMNAYAPRLLDNGLKAMIGKGTMSLEVKEALKKNKAVYFVAIGGAGALLSEKIISCEPIAFEDLGPEAIYKLEVKDFPVIVGIDSIGNSIYS
jgi:fumarate hydratase subunit beta